MTPSLDIYEKQKCLSALLYLTLLKDISFHYSTIVFVKLLLPFDISQNLVYLVRSVHKKMVLSRFVALQSCSRSRKHFLTQLYFFTLNRQALNENIKNLMIRRQRNTLV